MFCTTCGSELPDGSKFCSNCGQQVGDQTTSTPSPVSTTTNQTIPVAETIILPASAPQRLVNLIVDGIAAQIFSIVIVYIVAIQIDGGFMSGLLAFFGYHFILESLTQKTAGKLITGTKVVDRYGNKPSPGTIAIRTLCRFIPFEAFSFLFYGKYPIHGWHDRISGTLVVPDRLTPAEVQLINQETLKKHYPSSVLMIILIVIASGLFILMILGIVSSVFLASMNDAREAGNDAAARAAVMSARAQAEIYNINNSDSYLDLCKDPSLTGIFIGKLYSCYDNDASYAITVSLSDGTHYCVDNQGEVTSLNNNLSLDQTYCLTPQVPESETGQNSQSGSNETIPLSEGNPSTQISSSLNQAQALSKAQSYLNVSAFSRSGLIAKLESDGFSNMEATNAVDTLGADWNEQAVKIAEAYMVYYQPSRYELVKELMFNGFTQAEAEYGATAVGL